MSPLLRVVVTAMGMGRIAIGLAPFVAAGPTARLLGFPASHNTPTTRLMSRFFGTRDIGLGVLAFYAIRHPETAPFIFLFNALTDAGDLFAILIPLIRRQGIDRAAIGSAMFALSACMMWFIVWLIAR